MRFALPKRLKFLRNKLKSKLKRGGKAKSKVLKALDHAREMVDGRDDLLLGKISLIATIAFCLALWLLNSFYLTTATVSLLLVPKEPEVKETKSEDPSISSARTLATIYLLDQRLEKAEDLEI